MGRPTLPYLPFAAPVFEVRTSFWQRKQNAMQNAIVCAPAGIMVNTNSIDFVVFVCPSVRPSALS